MGDIGTLVSDLGGAVKDLFTGQGAAAEAQSFQGAADLANQNAALSAASTRIQETQTARSVFQSLGTTEADIAGAGFTNSGSALDILKSSASQGALAKSLVNIQGAINENSYAAQAGAYAGEAKAANEKSQAGTIGAIASIGGALLSGTNQLISAGKTVVQGVNTLTGTLFGGSAFSSAAVNGVGNGAGVGTALDSQFTLGGSTDLGSSVASQFSLSGTDSAINAGANLSTNLTLDTSGFSIGTTEAAADSAITDATATAAATAATDIGSIAADAIPVIGWTLLAAQAVHALGIGGTVGKVADDITGAVGSVVNGVVSAVSDAGSAIGNFFGSVICTALYQRGKLTRRVWNGAQRYGRDVAPPDVYAAYILWGIPIAEMIYKYDWFAAVVSPVFVPWAHELAVLAGEKTAVSTLLGRTIFRVTFAFSSLLGMLIRRGYVKARA